MELSEVIRRRRMYRSFTDRGVDPLTVDALLEQARRAPSAGHTQGWAWLVLEGPEQTRRFWEVDADPAWLAAPDHPGLLRAPVILVPWANPAAYEARYGEPDKSARSRPGGVAGAGGHVPGGMAGGSEQSPGGMAGGAEQSPGGTAGGAEQSPGGVAGVAERTWPVPWWHVDLAFAVMIVLLGATDRGLGALFFALHGEPTRLAAAFGVPGGWRPLGAIALGWPVADDPPSASAARGRRPAAEVIHRGTW